MRSPEDIQTIPDRFHEGGTRTRSIDLNSTVGYTAVFVDEEVSSVTDKVKNSVIHAACIVVVFITYKLRICQTHKTLQHDTLGLMNLDFIFLIRFRAAASWYGIDPRICHVA